MNTSGSGKLEQLACQKDIPAEAVPSATVSPDIPESQKVVAFIQSELAEIENLLPQLRYELVKPCAPLR